MYITKLNLPNALNHDSQLVERISADIVCALPFPILAYSWTTQKLIKMNEAFKRQAALLPFDLGNPLNIVSKENQALIKTTFTLGETHIRVPSLLQNWDANIECFYCLDHCVVMISLLKRELNTQLINDYLLDEHLSALLTPREKEVALLVVKGYTNDAIAKTLDLSTRSVRNYVSRVYHKLNVSKRSELIARLETVLWP